MCDPAHYSVIRVTADSEQEAYGKMEKWKSPEENNCRDMGEKKKENMGNVTNRQFRDVGWGKGVFEKERGFCYSSALHMCSPFFTECTSMVSPRGINNQTLTQHKFQPSFHP